MTEICDRNPSIGIDARPGGRFVSTFNYARKIQWTESVPIGNGNRCSSGICGLSLQIYDRQGGRISGAERCGAKPYEFSDALYEC